MIVVVTMPGALGSSGNKGSIVRPRVKEAARDVGVDPFFLREDDPTSKEARGFVKRCDRLGNRLLLVGKSLGGSRVILKVLKRVFRSFEHYDKVALLTVDPYGLFYGHGRIRDTIKLPKSLVEGNFKAINLYQRNGGLEGAWVKGAVNQEVSEFPDGRKVSHMTIVDHPDVVRSARDLFIWLVT